MCDVHLPLVCLAAAAEESLAGFPSSHSDSNRPRNCSAWLSQGYQGSAWGTRASKVELVRPSTPLVSSSSFAFGRRGYLGPSSSSANSR